ncbi:hypothetical protein TW95_gp1821 [Pandoravirus inopinatum]|uniref:Uncharacterized protein n=1 Tax=Pandoravirus inopinatum TaxID=1605721 RepID=A0A0B5J994_9VIRU|nr:hypothetical protein TW95_gp1821 [Pandoravirus inopinatum]AJF98555.1 hypothetical protein [Pandoravirus inopinatum]
MHIHNLKTKVCTVCRGAAPFFFLAHTLSDWDMILHARGLHSQPSPAVIHYFAFSFFFALPFVYCRTFCGSRNLAPESQESARERTVFRLPFAAYFSSPTILQRIGQLHKRIVWEHATPKCR